MADVPDRPAEATAPATTVAAPPGGGETYRPLSLLAILGFLLAGLYALFLAVGAVVALLFRSPWLLPTWTILWPLTALALCWVARTRIQSSEGTLGGQALVAWGVGLSLLFGLSYWSYYAATRFAVCQQANALADRWLTLVKEGKLEEAFLLTLPPAGRPRLDDPGWKDKLVNLLNVSKGRDPSIPGPFTQMCQDEMVRHLENGGADSRFTLLDVEEWAEKSGGYQVRLRYRIETPAAHFDALVTAYGVWPREASSRQWYIGLGGETGRARDGHFELTARGRQLDHWSNDAKGARAFVVRWTEALGRADLDAAFRATLPPDQRRRLDQGVRPGVLFGPGAVWRDADLRKLLAGRDTLGAVFHKAKDYFADPEVDKKVEQFRRFDPTLRRLAPMQRWTVFLAPPLYKESEKESEGRVTFRYGAQLLLPPVMILEARIVVQAERAALEKGDPDPWRIVGVELLSARDPGMVPGPGGPGGPAGPGPIQQPLPPAG